MRWFLLIKIGKPKEFGTYSVPLSEEKCRALFEKRRGMYNPGDLIMVQEVS